MTTAQRYDAILEYFKKNVPVAESELHFSSRYQLLVAVMLSAQCTDRRVNMTTPALFEAYPGPGELAAASPEEVYGYIKSISYPNSKARHLIEMARMLVTEFHSVIPSDIDSLMSLPGVGRKTANVVASILYDKPVIAVDTHVLRVSNRLGLSRGKTPEKVEADLESHIPVEQRAISHHWLILHGRYTCTARKPKCGECPLTQWCEYYSASDR